MQKSDVNSQRKYVQFKIMLCHFSKDINLNPVGH